jgi:hypothetical protein
MQRLGVMLKTFLSNKAPLIEKSSISDVMHATLRIVDTRLMNACLLVKWILRLYDGEKGLWAEIIQNKYLRDKDLL